MRDLPAQVAESIIRDDLGGAEVLELSRVRPGFFCQADEQFCSLQIAIVVGSHIRDEIGGMILSDGAFSDLNVHRFLLMRMGKSREIQEGWLIPYPLPLNPCIICG